MIGGLIKMEPAAAVPRWVSWCGLESEYTLSKFSFTWIFSSKSRLSHALEDDEASSSKQHCIFIPIALLSYKHTAQHAIGIVRMPWWVTYESMFQPRFTNDDMTRPRPAALLLSSPRPRLATVFQKPGREQLGQNEMIFLPQNEPFLTRVIRSYHSFNRWLLYRAHFVDAGAPLTMATDNNWFPPPPAATCPDILFALLWSVWEVWWLLLQLSPSKHVNWAKICIIYVPMPMYIITN